jgi:hydrogenase maturation protease
MEYVIIGIGQSLRGDDGAGLAAVKLWQKSYPETAAHPLVSVELLELPGLRLLEILQNKAGAILVDAVISGRPAGALHILTENQLETFGGGAGSAHGFGVAETLALGRQLYPAEMPPDIVLIGIEAASVALGGGLGAEVRHILPKAAKAIENHLQAWLNREFRE